jgi:hypothetical protein
MLLIKVPTSAQLADILTKGLHLPQSTMCVDGILGRRRTSTLKGTSVLKRGKVVKAIRVKSALERGVLQTWGAKARARHRLGSESSGRPAAGGESVG